MRWLFNERLRKIEEIRINAKLNAIEADMRGVRLVTDNVLDRVGVQQAVKDAIAEKDKRLTEKIKAWAPVIAAAVSTIGLIVITLITVLHGG